MNITKFYMWVLVGVLLTKTLDYLPMIWRSIQRSYMNWNGERIAKKWLKDLGIKKK